jgi:hypothetical protein
MKQTINFSHFVDAFQAIRPDNFSYAGLQVLFDYFEELEEDIGEEMEMDVIAICCDFGEYDLEDLQREYGDHEGEQWEELEDAIEWLEERTTVIATDDDTVIVQAF